MSGRDPEKTENNSRNTYGAIHADHQCQLCDDDSRTDLIENNEVALKWVATLFWSDYIVFNQSSITSIIGVFPKCFH